MNPAPTFPASSPLATVLVTTDFSSLAERAMLFAARLVPAGGNVIVLSVQHPRALSDTEYENGGWSEESTAQHQRHMDICRERLAGSVLPIAAGWKVETVILEEGNVAEAICRTARERKVDAICISSHGYTGLRASLLGSVAQAVVSKAPCTVVLVRGEPTV